MFSELVGININPIPESNVFGDVVNNQVNAGGETQLDLEYITSLARNANTFTYLFSDVNPYSIENEGFLAYLTYVNNQQYPPLVHSISYGDVEDNIFNVSNPIAFEYGQRCDLEFMKMGLRGISVIVSSGDDGIGNNVARVDGDVGCSKAFPAYPASSAYVTTVGATQLSDSWIPACTNPYSINPRYSHIPKDLQILMQCDGIREVASSSRTGGIVTSGGGFSGMNSRHDDAPWQIDVVSQYLNRKDKIPLLSYFTSNGRGYPDVSVLAPDYYVVLNGKIIRESGTSASAPVFASMVTLWNDIRLGSKQKPLGFLNPLLYDISSKHPEAFQDITVGDNACSAGYSLDEINCCEDCFHASIGWDAVTVSFVNLIR